eukprot:c20668_g2_i6.p1 GENE.c20668_g2_i6~~c20668_g2_i6.p1  ORF type:complete len:181 (+),score=34.99 c20668_g2_i6:100-642(+)
MQVFVHQINEQSIIQNCVVSVRLCIALRLFRFVHLGATKNNVTYGLVEYEPEFEEVSMTLRDFYPFGVGTIAARVLGFEFPESGKRPARYVGNDDNMLTSLKTLASRFYENFGRNTYYQIPSDVEKALDHLRQPSVREKLNDLANLVLSAESAQAPGVLICSRLDLPLDHFMGTLNNVAQ